MVLVHYGVTSSKNKCLQHGKFHAAGCQPDLVGWKMRWPELPHSLWSVKLDRDRLWQMLTLFGISLLLSDPPCHIAALCSYKLLSSLASPQSAWQTFWPKAFFLFSLSLFFFIPVSYTLSSFLFIFSFLALSPLPFSSVLLNSFFLQIFPVNNPVESQKVIRCLFPILPWVPSFGPNTTQGPRTSEILPTPTGMALR